MATCPVGDYKFHKPANLAWTKRARVGLFVCVVKKQLFQGVQHDRDQARAGLPAVRTQ